MVPRAKSRVTITEDAHDWEEEGKVTGGVKKRPKELLQIKAKMKIWLKINRILEDRAMKKMIKEVPCT